MKRIALLITIVFLLALAQLSQAAESIDVQGDWYIKLTNFSMYGEVPKEIYDAFWDDWYEEDNYWFGYTNVDFEGFTKFRYCRSTTQLIKFNFLDQFYGDKMGDYRTLVIDFNAGSLSIDDYAIFDPYTTLGTNWFATISFDWEIYCTDPRLRFLCYTWDINSPVGSDPIWWSIPEGTGYRSGTASFDTQTCQGFTPRFELCFVPEPSSLAGLILGVPLAIRIFRRKK